MVKSEGTTYAVELSNEYKKQAIKLMFESPDQAVEESENVQHLLLAISKQFDGWLFVANTMRGFLNLELIRNYQNR